MPIKVTKADDPIITKSLNMVLYGSPGFGKTSLGFTARKPLLIDFDKGAHRAKIRGDSIQVGSWADVSSITREDVADYDTLVFDTVGRLLDTLTAHIITTSPKNGRGGGNLSMQGFGVLKAEFTAFANMLRSWGKHVIFIAHEKEDKDGDKRVLRPDIVGGSYGEVHKLADMIGCCYVDGQSHVIGFAPTESYTAKDSAMLGAVMVDRNSVTFMGDLIDSALKSINERNKGSAEANAMVLAINAATDAESLTTALQSAKEKKLDTPVVKQVVQAKAKALGLKYDKDGAMFVTADKAKD